MLTEKQATIPSNISPKTRKPATIPVFTEFSTDDAYDARPQEWFVHITKPRFMHETRLKFVMEFDETIPDENAVVVPDVVMIPRFEHSVTFTTMSVRVVPAMIEAIPLPYNSIPSVCEFTEMVLLLWQLWMMTSPDDILSNDMIPLADTIWGEFLVTFPTVMLTVPEFVHDSTVN